MVTGWRQARPARALGDTSQYDSTGTAGSGWNVFVTSDPLGPLALTEGEKAFSLSVSGGDLRGVEIDRISLERVAYLEE